MVLVPNLAPPAKPGACPAGSPVWDEVMTQKPQRYWAARLSGRVVVPPVLHRERQSLSA